MKLPYKEWPRRSLWCGKAEGLWHKYAKLYPFGITHWGASRAFGMYLIDQDIYLRQIQCEASHTQWVFESRAGTFGAWQSTTIARS